MRCNLSIFPRAVAEQDIYKVRNYTTLAHCIRLLTSSVGIFFHATFSLLKVHFSKWDFWVGNHFWCNDTSMHTCQKVIPFSSLKLNYIYYLLAHFRFRFNWCFNVFNRFRHLAYCIKKLVTLFPFVFTFSTNMIFMLLSVEATLTLNKTPTISIWLAHYFWILFSCMTIMYSICSFILWGVHIRQGKAASTLQIYIMLASTS